MAANNNSQQDQHRFSVHGTAQTVVAGLILAGVLGGLQVSADTNRKLAEIGATIGSVRRDVDRHETMINRQEYSLLELRAQARQDKKAIY